MYQKVKGKKTRLGSVIHKALRRSSLAIFISASFASNANETTVPNYVELTDTERFIQAGETDKIDLGILFDGDSADHSMYYSSTMYAGTYALGFLGMSTPATYAVYYGLEWVGFIISESLERSGHEDVAMYFPHSNKFDVNINPSNDHLLNGLDLMTGGGSTVALEVIADASMSMGYSIYQGTTTNMLNLMTLAHQLEATYTPSSFSQQAITGSVQDIVSDALPTFNLPGSSDTNSPGPFYYVIPQSEHGNSEYNNLLVANPEWYQQNPNNKFDLKDFQFHGYHAFSGFFNMIATDSKDYIYNTNYAKAGGGDDLLVNGNFGWGGEGDDSLFNVVTARGEAGNDYFLYCDTAYGGDGDDFISRSDTAYGGDGDDIITYASVEAHGEGGNDTISGTHQPFKNYYVPDTFFSSAQVTGGTGNDNIKWVGIAHGNEGDDILIGNKNAYGDEGNDVLIGNVNSDGGAGNDYISGRLVAEQQGLDVLAPREQVVDTYTTKAHSGGDGNDQILGYEGSDIIHGDAGYDVISEIVEQDQYNFVDGGSEYDSLKLEIEATWDLKVVTAASMDAKGEYLDVLSQAYNNDWSSHMNTISDDFDFLIAALDPQTAEWKAVMVVKNIEELLIEDNSNGGSKRTVDFSDLDRSLHYQGSTYNNSIFGSAHADIIQGMLGDDRLNGGDGNDILDGGAGNDNLYGGDGDDIFYPGSGNNVIIGGDGNDTLSYANSAEGVIVRLNKQEGVRSSAVDVIKDIENIIGSDFNDQLYGNSKANTLVGGAGNDILRSGAGDDVLISGSGRNRLYGGYGADIFEMSDAEHPTVIKDFHADQGDVIRLNVTGLGIPVDANGEPLLSSKPDGIYHVVRINEKKTQLVLITPGKTRHVLVNFTQETNVSLDDVTFISRDVIE